MINKWLLDNVKNCLSKGYDINNIYYQLNKYGYSYQDIKDAVEHINNPAKKKFELSKISLGTLNPKVQFLIKYIFPALAIFIIVVGFLLISSTDETPLPGTQNNSINITCEYACCSDSDCNDRNESTIDKCAYPNNPLAACQHTVKQQTAICGDNVCDEGENSETCCLDCPCESGICIDNTCQAEEKRCIVDSECNDYNSTTKDVCNEEGICVHENITTCRDNDEYCPIGCTTSNDNDCQELCTLDSDCDDNNASTTDSCAGVPMRCRYEVITECIDEDDVCPSGCTSFSDSDCQRDSCQSDSDCPTQDPCRPGKCKGTPKLCSYEPITQCLAGDNCCPVGCNSTTDSDCPREEECLFDFECEDYNNATSDFCNDERICEHTQITQCLHGDNYCPSTCRYPQDTDCAPIDQCRTNLECNDNNAGTRDECTGTPKRCVNTAITNCVNNDGYCPSNCNYGNDNDCPRTNECNTNADCSDNLASTRDECVGNPKRCMHTEILECRNGDNYCPPGCSANTDTDCGAQTSPTTPSGEQQPQQPPPSGPNYAQLLEEAYSLIGQNGSVMHMLSSFPDLIRIKNPEMNRRCGYYIGYVYSALADSTFIYCPRQGVTYVICQGRKTDFSTLFCRGSLS